VFSANINDILSDRLLNRLEVTEDGSLAGDNRSFRMFNVIDLIKSEPSVFWFSADPVCRFYRDECKKNFH